MKFALNNKAKGFHDSNGINFWFLFYFFPEIGSWCVFVDLEKIFCPDTSGVNFEVL